MRKIYLQFMYLNTRRSMEDRQRRRRQQHDKDIIIENIVCVYMFTSYIFSNLT